VELNAVARMITDHLGVDAQVWLRCLNEELEAELQRLEKEAGVMGKDLPALWQYLNLVRRLKRWPDPTAVAYLESDLMFLRKLFDHFPFSPRLRSALDQFIDVTEREVVR